jgi:hypothetical protein
MPTFAFAILLIFWIWVIERRRAGGNSHLAATGPRTYTGAPPMRAY